LSYTRIIFSIILMLMNVLAIKCQTSNFDQIITPADQRPRDFEEYLVQLAWNNAPQNAKTAARVNIAKAKLKATKGEWGNAVGGNVGINPRDSLSAPGIANLPNGAIVYPGYNFGISLNLGPLLTAKGKVTAAKEEIKVAEAEVNELKITIRTQTLMAYRHYLTTIEILKARVQALESASANRTFLRERFNSNKAEYDDLNAAENTYFKSLEDKIVAEGNIQIAKIDLEGLIGIKYEVAEKYKTKLQ
jgi:outer membrane protein TolC